MRGSFRTSVVLSNEDYTLLKQGLLTPDGCENFAVLFCGAARGNGWSRLLTRELWHAPRDAYQQRLPYHLEVAPAFFNRVVDHCLAQKLHPVVTHSHPASGRALYSPSDDFGESRLLRVLKQLLPWTTPGSLLVTPSDTGGRLYEDGRLINLERIEVRGLESRTFTVSPLTPLNSIDE